MKRSRLDDYIPAQSKKHSTSRSIGIYQFDAISSTADADEILAEDRYDDAMPHYQKHVNRLERLLAPIINPSDQPIIQSVNTDRDMFSLACVHRRIGDCLIGLNRFSSALLALHRALTVLKHLYDPSKEELISQSINQSPTNKATNQSRVLTCRSARSSADFAVLMLYIELCHLIGDAYYKDVDLSSSDQSTDQSTSQSTSQSTNPFHRLNVILALKSLHYSSLALSTATSLCECDLVLATIEAELQTAKMNAHINVGGSRVLLAQLGVEQFEYRNPQSINQSTSESTNQSASLFTIAERRLQSEEQTAESQGVSLTDDLAWCSDRKLVTLINQSINQSEKHLKAALTIARSYHQHQFQHLCYYKLTEVYAVDAPRILNANQSINQSASSHLTLAIAHCTSALAVFDRCEKDSKSRVVDWSIDDRCVEKISTRCWLVELIVMRIEQIWKDERPSINDVLDPVKYPELLELLKAGCSNAISLKKDVQAAERNNGVAVTEDVKMRAIQAHRNMVAMKKKVAG